jgi:glutaredoxin
MDKYNKLVVVFTMDGCPFCEMMKTQLSENNIEFFERDIHKHEDEYKMFVEATGSEFVPAFMIIKDALGTPETIPYVPDKDYNTIEEGVQIIKEAIK